MVPANTLKKLTDAEDKLAIIRVMSEVSAKTGSDAAYTGNPIPLVNAPTTALPEGHAMRYALGKDATTAPEEGWGEDVPTGSNAGTYHVWYKAVSDKDQGDSEPACTEAVIAKAQSSVGKAPAAIKRTYNGKAQTLVNAGAAQGGTMQYSLDNKNFSDEPPVATDAGTYTVWYKVKGDANHYDVYYRVHAQQFGWMGWAKNGEQAGTAGFSYRLEAIQIVLVPKGAKAPAATYRGAQQLTARAFAEKGKA